MNEPADFTRRAMLQRLALGLSLAPIARAAAPTLLNEKEPAAKAVQYVEDALRASQAQSGATCANCSIYTAKNDSEGSCTLFKDRLVKAAGWCNAWSGL